MQTRRDHNGPWPRVRPAYLRRLEAVKEVLVADGAVALHAVGHADVVVAQLDRVAGTLQRTWKQIEKNEMLRQIQHLGKILSEVDLSFKPKTQHEQNYARGREKVYRARIQRACAGIGLNLPAGRKLIQDAQHWCSRHLDLDSEWHIEGYP